MNTERHASWVVVCGILPILCIAGCTTGRRYEPVRSFDKQKALLYVYRKSNIFGAAVEHDLYIDNEKKMKVVNGGYSVAEIDPGLRKIFTCQRPAVFTLLSAILEQAIVGKKEMFSFEAEPGQVYYMRFRLMVSDKERNTVHSMVMMDKSVAEKEISKCGYVPLSKEQGQSG